MIRLGGQARGGEEGVGELVTWWKGCRRGRSRLHVSCRPYWPRQCLGKGNGVENLGC